MCGPYLVITSWPDLDGARQQVSHWVENKLAARVNILPKMDSIYVWDGQLRNGTEHKIFIKTWLRNSLPCKAASNRLILTLWQRYCILR